MERELRTYVAFAMDALGIAHATYEISCETDEEAKRRAAKYLQMHECIELWLNHRRVARLTR